MTLIIGIMIDNHNDADNDGVDVESFAGTVTA